MKNINNMKILIINYEFPPLGGGASPITYDLAKGYVQSGHDVDVVTMGYKGLPREEKIDGINVFRVRCLRSKKEICTPVEMLSFLIPALIKSYKLQKKECYDINHTHFIIPSGIVSFFLKKLTGLNYIITSHGSDVPGFNTDRFKGIHLFTKPILKIILRGAKGIISPSSYLKRLIHTKTSKDLKIDIIPNGIDLSEYRPRKKQNIILSSGRALARKGFQHIIEAVHDMDIPWEVHIASDGPYLDELKQLAKGSRTKIVFHGWIDKKKMIDLTSRAGIYMLVSERENASLALLEGLASGCAMITSDSTGCAETVGKAGELVRFGDVKEIKRKILKVIKDVTLYQKKGLERSKKYDIKIIISDYIKRLK